MNTKKIYVDKTYRLKREAAPLTFMLASHNTKRKPLLHFDENSGTNRALRYARNQKSPFEDEQDGNAILEPVIFEDGMLHVPKNNQVLQEFLYYHPSRDSIYEEVNNERDAADDVEVLEQELNAQIVASELEFDKMLSVARVLLGGRSELLSTSELKRDVLLFAKRDPYTFLEVVNDPDLEFEDEVRQFFAEKLLSFRNKKKDVYFNLPGNKTKMLTIPFGEDPYHVVASYLKTDEGVDVYKGLIKKLK